MRNLKKVIITGTAAFLLTGMLIFSYAALCAQGIKKNDKQESRDVKKIDEAIKTGSIEPIKEYIPQERLKEIEDKLNKVVEKKKNADRDVGVRGQYDDEYKQFLQILQSLIATSRERVDR